MYIIQTLMTQPLYKAFEKDWQLIRNNKLSELIEIALNDKKIKYNLSFNLDHFIWILRHASQCFLTDWENLTDCFNTTFDIIIKYSDETLPWKWYQTNKLYYNRYNSYKINLTEFIRHNLHFPWDWSELSEYHNI